MASSPKFFDRVQETSTTTGTGTYTLAGAITGFQTFAAVGNNNSCIYCAAEVDANGNPSGAWEVNVGTYTAAGTTLSRDTLRASSTGSAINWAAGTRRLFLVSDAAFQTYGGLINQALPADGAVAMEVGCLHVGTIAAYTADRTATLPATAAVGDRCGLMLTVGDDTYHLLVTATAGDTLTGNRSDLTQANQAVAGGTEWSRLFIAGEVLIFRCTVANTAWVVEVDGRIPQAAWMELTTQTDLTQTASVYSRPQTDQGATWTIREDNGSGCVAATDSVKCRRAASYRLTGTGISIKADIGVGLYFAVVFRRNDPAAASNILIALSNGFTALATRASSTQTALMAAGDLIYYLFTSNAANSGLDAVTETHFIVKEIK